MTIIYWLEQIQSSDRLAVGDKALQLSQLQRQGYPILPGFVISSQTFQESLDRITDSASLLADFPRSSRHLNVDNPQSLQFIAQKSREAILQSSLLDTWQLAINQAVHHLDATTLIFRASLCSDVPLTHNISGLLPAKIAYNHPHCLEACLKEIWAQFFNAKHLFYWQRQGINLEKINLAILVQPIYNAIATGTATLDHHTLTLKAVWGLGHSLLLGEVSPDVYQIDLSTKKVIDQQLGQKNRAYRLTNPSDCTSCPSTGLESYPLSSQEQETYILTDSTLNYLSELLPPLVTQPFPFNEFEWTIPAQSRHLRSQFYLTQWTTHAFNPSSADTVSSAQSMLKGISASSGIVHAPVYILEDNPTPIPSNHILVAKTFLPHQLPWLKQAAGIVLERGGMTSHAAILARELGIPAVIGVAEATQILKKVEKVQIDGNVGTVVPIDADNLPSSVESSPTSAPLTVFPYPIATALMVNLSQPELLTHPFPLPIDGVGLVRSELMLLDLFNLQPLSKWLESDQKADFVTRLADSLTQFADMFADKPVFYRTFDGTVEETSPSSLPLTHRGTAGYLADSSLFELELEAIRMVQRTGFSHLRLILPFVRSVEEFRFCQRLVQGKGLADTEGFQLWIMAEVPSVIFQLADYVQAGVQGIAIGSNDLAQLLLGWSRETTAINPYRKACHPALLNALKWLITQANDLNIPCSLCGHLPAESPEVIEQLIEWGITAISVEPQDIVPVYQAIARAEQRLLLKMKRKSF